MEIEISHLGSILAFYTSKLNELVGRCEQENERKLSKPVYSLSFGS